MVVDGVKPPNKRTRKKREIKKQSQKPTPAHSNRSARNSLNIAVFVSTLIIVVFWGINLKEHISNSLNSGFENQPVKLPDFGGRLDDIKSQTPRIRQVLKKSLPDKQKNRQTLNADEINKSESPALTDSAGAPTSTDSIIKYIIQDKIQENADNTDNK